MGAQSSKENINNNSDNNNRDNTLNEAKVNLGNISTSTMAFDGGSNHNGRQSKGKGASSKVSGEVYSLHKYPSQGTAAVAVTASPVRFSPSSDRSRMDLNGNHFYTNSLGRSSVNSSAVATTTEDSNNNNIQYDSKKGTTSKSTKAASSDQFDKCSPRSVTPTKPVSVSNAPDRFSSQRSGSTIAVTVPKKAEKSTTKMPREKNKSNGFTVVVFVVELLTLLGLTAFAYVLHYTDSIPMVKRPFECSDKSLQYPEKFNYESIYMSGTSDNTFHLIFLLAPVGLLILLEIVRQLILFGLTHHIVADTSVEKKQFAFSFPIYARRIIRFVGGFLFGALITSIVVDILKFQTGHYRPFFLSKCANFSFASSTCTTNETDLERYCTKDELRMVRSSFPSLTAAMLSYSVVFIVLYLSFALPYRAIRFVRLLLLLGLSLLTGLVLNVRLNTNQSHVIDVIIGVFIGVFFALFIVFIHLNAFANRLSNSNFFGANRNSRDRTKTEEHDPENGDLFDEISHSNLFAENDKDWFWKNFHIPRVHTLRQSARNMWRRSENYFHRPTTTDDSVTRNTPNSNHKLSNAYINPAFNGREENILANHIHQESRFGSRDNGSNHNNSVQPQRNTLRTFQVNS